MNLVDIAAMPDFRADALTTADSLEQARSVTRGRVYHGFPASGGGLPTVCCVEHGAMLCVAINAAGKLWRCPACNEGAFAPAVLS